MTSNAHDLTFNEQIPNADRNQKKLQSRIILIFQKRMIMILLYLVVKYFYMDI